MTTRRSFTALLIAIALFLTAPAPAQPQTQTLPEASAGALDVASTPLLLKPASVELTQRCLAGFRSRDREAREVWALEQLLQDAGAARHVRVKLPFADASLGESYRVDYLLLYPTEKNRRDPAAVLEFQLPRMQRKGEPAMLAGAAKKLPLIVYCHAYNTHPLTGLRDLAILASHGYVIACPFFGDGRLGRQFAWPALDRLRAEAVAGLIEQLRGDAEFGNAIDFEHVGLYGVAVGARSGLALAGEKPLVHAVFAECGLLDPLAQNPDAVAGVSAPVFLLRGGNDETSFASMKVISMLRSDHFVIELPNDDHPLSDASRKGPATTWALRFFDAYLKQDEASKELLRKASAVSGATVNRVTVRVMAER